MADHNKEIQKFTERLEKATYNGEQGKFRRLKGKTVFIRSKDKKVTKGPNKGKRLLMKSTTSIAGYKDVVGETTSKVMLTQKKKKHKKGCNCQKEQSVFKSIQKNLDTIVLYMESLKSEEKK